MAPTRSALEKLIRRSSDYCKKYGLTFNAKKSQIVVFSKKMVVYERLKLVTMDGNKIDYVDSVTYLGITTIVNDNGLSFSSTNDLMSFYRASNSILSMLKKPGEEVLLQLLYSNCIPTLTYACNVKDYPPRQMQNCNTAVNDALRSIFGFNRWESIRALRESFGYKSLTEIFNNSKKRFNDSLTAHHNSVIVRIARNLSLE